MNARLVSYKNGKMDLAFPLADSLTGIGRAPDNLVQLAGTEVSKHHAAIRHTPAGWVVEDLGSRNGVLLNGVRVQRSAIEHGDKIAIGPHELVFESQFRDTHWVPDHVIDFSTDAGQKTVQHAPMPPPRADKDAKG